MDETHDGRLGADLLHADWRKSARSNPSGNCVELERAPGGAVALRNCRDPRGAVHDLHTDDGAALSFGRWGGAIRPAPSSDRPRPGAFAPVAPMAH